jgi:hypothetical protein
MVQVLGITGLQAGSACTLVQGQLPEIFRFAHFLAVTDAALPSSVGQTAVAFPHQLTR